MLYYETVESKTLELLNKLMSVEEFKELRLVGGTSLALQIGHRNSIDIDLFGSIDIEEFELNSILSSIGEITILKKSKNINVYLVNGIKVDIVNYPFPWIEQRKCIDNIRLAENKDIAAMKISAITGRGSKKDFIDLYFLKIFSLDEILEFYKLKYNDAAEFLALKSLVYFEDADNEEMPRMFLEIEWEEIKTQITEIVNIYLSKIK